MKRSTRPRPAPLEAVNRDCGRICISMREHVHSRYRAYQPFDSIEAEMLKQLEMDEWRAESYCMMARLLTGIVDALKPHERESGVGLQYVNMLAGFNEMVDRYDGLFHRELRQLLFHRDALESRLARQAGGTKHDPQACEDFCVTMQAGV